MGYISSWRVKLVGQTFLKVPGGLVILWWIFSGRISEEFVGTPMAAKFFSRNCLFFFQLFNLFFFLCEIFYGRIHSLFLGWFWKLISPGHPIKLHHPTWSEAWKAEGCRVFKHHVAWTRLCVDFLFCMERGAVGNWTENELFWEKPLKNTRDSKSDLGFLMLKSPSSGESCPFYPSQRDR